MTANRVTFTVYTLTSRGRYSEKHNGTSETEALKAYNGLAEANKPRLLLHQQGNILRVTPMMASEHFSEFRG